MADNNQQTSNTNSPVHIIADYYDSYTKTQKQKLLTEVRKTRNSLFIMSAIFLIATLLGIAKLNAIRVETVLAALIIPVFYIGLALLSLKEPVVAIIIAALIVAGIWIYSIAMAGISAIVTGWLVKAVVFYLLITGFRHAAEANRIKRELKT